MPFIPRKRVRSSKFKPTYRRVQRKTYVPRPMRRAPMRGIIRSSAHSFRRMGQNISNDSFTTESPRSLEFALNKIQGHTELTSLYDQFKINKVVVKFQLVNVPDTGLVYAPGTNTGTYQSTNFYPRIYYYRDHDSSSTKTLIQMREIGKVKSKILMPNRTISIAIKPSVLTQMYNTAVSAAYAPKFGQKLDCTNSDTPHYSLVYTYDTLNKTSTTAYEVKIDTIYYFTMYNSR